MTEATSPNAPIIYPQYCFELSPTINRWCHLRAADIHALVGHPGFEGQNVFFHTNHPIKWVRVAGVVVAIDEPPGKRIYTVDDSSGATVECVVNAAQLPVPEITTTTSSTSTRLAAGQEQEQQQQQVVDYDIDVGDVVDVKGGLKVFRDEKQIVVEKAVHLRSTAQEVLFWNKLAQLRADVLSRPWVLDRKEVRRCRKRAEGVEEEKEKEKEKKEKEKERKRRGRGKAQGLESVVRRRSSKRREEEESRRGGDDDDRSRRARTSHAHAGKQTGARKAKRITGLESTRPRPLVEV